MKDTKIGILNRQIWRLVLEARPYLVLAPFVSSPRQARPAVAVERAVARPLPAQGPGNLDLTRDPKERTGKAAGDRRPDQN